MAEISVIIPAYNADKTVYKTVSSVLNNTYKNIEVLIIDDGSTDETAKTVLNIANADPRVKLIQKQNGGVSAARNCGINAAIGKYIMFCDADDTYLPNMINSLYESITNNNSDLAMCGYNEITGANAIERLSPVKTALTGKDEIFKGFIEPVAFSGTNGFMGAVWTSIYKTQIIKKNCLSFNSEMFFSEDTLFLVQYLLFCNKISSVQKALYNYELGDGSVTKKYSGRLMANNSLYEQELKNALQLASIDYTLQMRGKRAVAYVISLIVNEARKGNTSSFLQQLKHSASFGKAYKKDIKPLVSDNKTLKIKRLIALHPFFAMMFFTMRRIQRARGVSF